MVPGAATGSIVDRKAASRRDLGAGSGPSGDAVGLAAGVVGLQRFSGLARRSQLAAGGRPTWSSSSHRLLADVDLEEVRRQLDDLQGVAALPVGRRRPRPAENRAATAVGWCM